MARGKGQEAVTTASKPRMAVDTSVAVLMFQTRPKQVEAKRARSVRELIADGKFTFVFPATVVLELLAATPAARRDEIRTKLALFEVATFGFAAAAATATIAEPPSAEERKRSRVTWDKPRVKYDAMVVGAAVAAKVDAFCSFDENQRGKFSRLAPGKAVGPPCDFLPPVLAAIFQDV